MSLDVGGPVELLIWRSASSLEAAPMWVSPTQDNQDSQDKTAKAGRLGQGSKNRTLGDNHDGQDCQEIKSYFVWKKESIPLKSFLNWQPVRKNENNFSLYIVEAIFVIFFLSRGF